MGDMIPISTLEGGAQFDAYVAKPAGQAKAAIVVIQEIFGINPGIRAKCDALAADGYLAYAPDLFWRLEPHIILDPDIPDQLQTAFDAVESAVGATVDAPSAQTLRAVGSSVSAFGDAVNGFAGDVTTTC